MTRFDEVLLADRRKRWEIQLAWGRTARDLRVVRQAETELARLDVAPAGATDGGNAT